MAEIHGKNGAFYAARGIRRSNTLAFAISPSRITDSANGFVTAGFAVDMGIVVVGSASNDGSFTITHTGVAAGTLTLTTAPTPEAAGPLITVYESAPGGAPVGFTSWTIDWNHEVVESTDFQDAGARTYVPGITSWSGSSERNYSADDNIWGGAVDGTYQWVRLFTHYVAIPSGGEPATYYEGLALVTSSNIIWPVDGLVTQKFDFTGIGTLTPVSKTTAW